MRPRSAVIACTLLLAAAIGGPVAARPATPDPSVRDQALNTKLNVQARGKVSAAGAASAAAHARTATTAASDKTSAKPHSAPARAAAAAATQIGAWLAGDLHVHTCYSHDVYCPQGQQGTYFHDHTMLPVNTGPVNDAVKGPLNQAGLGDGNTDAALFYTFGGTVDERFQEASLKGLDYLAITDHHSDGDPAGPGLGFGSVNDPGFGGYGVIGIPGYENSISGHAQMLGAKQVYLTGGNDAAHINAMADLLRADDGIFQANHPAEGINHQVTGCDDLGGMHWSYGYTVPVESVEVWNISELQQEPAPASASNADAVTFWECMLSRGSHVAATGGSDSHWLATAAVQGVGNPTTWIFSGARTWQGLLQAIKAGRTSISVQSPAAGGTRLMLEGDVNHDGGYEAMIGDTVPIGTPLRVRAVGTPGAGLVSIRTGVVNTTSPTPGATLVDAQPLLPGGVIDFTAPAGAGWLYATLSAPEALAQRTSTCDVPANQVLALFGKQTAYCRAPIATLAMTSAIYVR